MGDKRITNLSEFGLDLKLVGQPDGSYGLLVSLPAGSVNIGDVDVVSLPALPSGSNNIGTAGQYGIATVNWTRPANTTAYTAKDALGVNLAVTGATNASPIVITATAHGMSDGDYCTIASVGGNTNANGSFYVKRTGYTVDTFGLYSDKALQIPVAGNSNYTSGGTIARLFRLKDVLRVDGGAGWIGKFCLRTDLSTFADQLKIHVYSQPVPALLDNAAYTLLWANISYRLGSLTLPAMGTSGTGSTAAVTLGAPGGSSPMESLFVRNTETPPSKDLWFMIEDLSAGTPASAQNFNADVMVDQY